MNGLLYMLSGESSTAGLENEVKDLWNTEILPVVNIVIWVLVAVLAVVFIIKGVMTALAVMKAADEPQVRQEKINGFKYLAIGLGVAIVILTLANVIMNLVSDNAAKLNESSMLF